MKQKTIISAVAAIVLLVFAIPRTLAADAFVHPGGLLTQADLGRMKARVGAGEHPWIDSWNALLEHPKAQLSYRPAPRTNIGASRQRASADAVAAYLNAIRGYISGDTAYTDNAIRICNLWSAAVNQQPTGADEPGLNGIFTYEFAVVGELLRSDVGTRWAPADFDRFKKMFLVYLYPPCHDFLIHHDGAPITHFWANWDLCNMTAIVSIGVLCDDRAKFDEAIEYFKNGAGNGSVKHAVPFLYPGGLGQWQETGRDQEHSQLGVGLMGAFCQIAWNQNQDMYGYDNNRFLAGAEYVAAYNLWKPVPYTFYNNADNVNNYWASEQTWGGRGRLQRPIWEMIYNHYVVLKGMNAPNVKAMAEIYRPEGIEHDDNFGFGTLTFTLNAAASPFPPAHSPPRPEGLSATAGVARVWLRWTPAPTANGYNVLRSAAPGGPYQTIASYTGVFPVFQDATVNNATTYYYVISAKNQTGTSPNSTETSATPEPAGKLPADWTRLDIGQVTHPGAAEFAHVADDTFIISGAGEGIGDRADGLCFVYKKFTGDITFTAERALSSFSGGARQKIGIMIRDSLDPSAQTAAMVSGDVGAREAKFGVRSAAHAPMIWQNGDAYTPPGPATWFRLNRSADTFTAYQSIDGVTWFQIGSPAKIDMATNCYIGFAVSSNSEKIDSATFDHVKLEANSR